LAISAISTATNTLTDTIGVGNGPVGIAIRLLVNRTRPPVADAYVRAGSFAATNFGSATTLFAKKGISPDNTFRSYLTFDVNDVDAFTRAALRVEGRVANVVTPAVTVTVYAVSDTTWNEQAVTGNTRPDLGVVLGTLTVTGTTPRNYELDVTKFLRAERAAGRSRVTFALRSITHTSAEAAFKSREATSLQPQLVIGR
jgi:hyaluronate lyase